mgnify:CR=1 FL=1
MPLIEAFGQILDPYLLLILTTGVLSGIVFGAVPGLTGGMLMVLALPLTFYMDSMDAIVLLVGMYVGGTTGGLITAILLRIPGSPANVVTTLDGHPMARAGKAERALALAVVASFIGGAISWVFLAALSPLLSRIALTFSSFEYFSFIMMGLVLIGAVSAGSNLKGFMAAIFGMLVAMPGLDGPSGQMRLTFGISDLAGGLHYMPVLIGVFAGAALINEIISNHRAPEAIATVSVRRTLREMGRVLAHRWNLLRSSVIGTFVGLLPGVGGNIGSIVAYTVARSSSRNPDQFGHGSEAGIVASESANNATIGGALIPLITMGIPGSVADILLLSALIIHNVRPGPMLINTHPDLYYGIISAALIGNIIMIAAMVMIIPRAARLAQLPKAGLVPVIFLFCVLGTFALHNNPADIWVMAVFALVGFGMERTGYPLAPFVIGLILSPIAEEALRSSLMASAGSYAPFFTRPISLACLLIAFTILIWPLVVRRRLQIATSDAGD